MNRPIVKIMPSSYNFMGLLAACITAATVPHWWSEIFLILSLLLGGFKGHWITLRSPTSALGTTISSVMNRITEVFWAIAFYRLGTPLTWVFAFAGLAAFQEYAKAKITSIGIQSIDVNTMVNRPTRSSFLFMAILIYQYSPSHTWITAIAAVLTFVQALSFLLLMRVAFKQLR
jgi:archaetidylinositol phosphate synthase